MNNNCESRPNKKMAALIDEGIALLMVCGREKIYVCLAARGVPDAVLERILCEPDKRRESSAAQ